MRKITKFLSSHSTYHYLVHTFNLFDEPILSRLSIRCKSSRTRRPSSKTSAYPRLKQTTSSSLYQNITDIVGNETDRFNGNHKAPTFDEEVTIKTLRDGSPVARRIAQESNFHVCHRERTSENDVPEQTHVGIAVSNDVSPIVHRITEVVRSQKPGSRMEERLNDLGFSFNPEIVEKVLKRCFKVGHLALRFFNWVKLRPGFRHTTDTYNTMIYIAGESKEFDLVERLVGEMDESIPKNVKTWTILIKHYGEGKQIGKALCTFEAMRKLGCQPDSEAYKATLRALCTAKKPELALEFYKELSLKDMVIDANLYGMLMDCLSTMGNIEVMTAVGDDMRRIVQISEDEVYTRIMKSFCISGRLEEARRLFELIKKKVSPVDSKFYEIFLKGLCRDCRMAEALQVLDEMKKKKVVSSEIYGFLVIGFCRICDVPKALELLRGMRELGFMPTLSSYTRIIQNLFNSNEYLKACELYTEMLNNGIEPDIVAITAVVTGHVRHNRISEAWEVFDGMKKKGIRPKWKSYSVFIKELCRVSKPDEAFKLLNEMSVFGIDATEDIYRLVTSSFTRNGELETARKVEQMRSSYNFQILENDGSLHEENEDVNCSVDQSLIPNQQPENEAVNCSVDQNLIPNQQPTECSDGDLKEVIRIFSSSSDWSSMQEDLEACTIDFTPELVEAVLRKSQKNGRAALQFFSWVRKQAGYQHTAETYNMAIKISGGGKDFMHMRNLYQEMKRNGCCITPDTWTIMIAQYGQAGLTEIALKTFKEMKIDGYQPNGSTYKYLIVFLCGKKGRKVDEAIKIFQEIIGAGYIPDKETVGIYLSSLCEFGKLEEAKISVRSLCKRGFEWQLAYSLLVRSLCRAGRVDVALELTNEMEKIGCKLDGHMYGSIIHGLFRGGHIDEALDKIESMRRSGISQSAHIHTSMIVHFCKDKKIQKAEEIFKRMREEGCEPTVVTYSAMIRGYMNMGMFADARNLFRRMKLKGPQPDFETYSMFMDCLCKSGRSEEAMLLINQMLGGSIIPSCVNFRTVFHGLNREGKHDLAHSVLQTKWLLNRNRKFLV